LVDIAAGVDVAILSPIRQALRDGHNDGSLHIDDVSAAASVVYGAVLVTGMQHLLLGTSGDLANRSDAISNVILRGIGGKRTPRQSRRTTTGGT
jgi:hypothetical protein